MNKTPSVSDKIFSNTLYNTAGRFSEILVSIFLAPYIISHIGIERYGIWVIAYTLSFFLGFLDFSLADPIVKYIAEYYARKDIKQFIRLFNTGFVFFIFLSLICITIGVPLSSLIVQIFNVQDYLFQEAVYAVRMGFYIFSVMTLYLFIIFISYMRCYCCVSWWLRLAWTHDGGSPRNDSWFMYVFGSTF
jgi:O-antigen/teichoic acid export membrane protein